MYACISFLQALTLYSEDDDFYLAAATCYMRLNRYEDALSMLQEVLARSPKNYKALYQHAFCQRASGAQKSAIEGLTKVSKSWCFYSIIKYVTLTTVTHLYVLRY